MARTTVHLLRHGEVHNPDAVLYGRLPGFRLSDDGQQMARDQCLQLVGLALRAGHEGSDEVIAGVGE